MILGSERLFVATVRVLNGAVPPAFFVRLMGPNGAAELDAWLSKRSLSPAAITSAAWKLFLLLTGAMVVAGAAAFALGGSRGLLCALGPCLILPILAAGLFAATPASLSRAEDKLILRDTPTVIGSISISMQLEPSIERGVIFAATNSDGALSEKLREVVWRTLTRRSDSVINELHRFISSLSERNDSLRQALQLILSATRERTKEGMDRLLDKANAVVIAGVKDSVDRYVASLATPAMVLFSLGILLPVMLVSMVPLLSMGTSFSSSSERIGLTGGSLPTTYLALLLVGVFPVATLAYARSLLARNPVQSFQELSLRLDAGTAATLVAWVGAVSLAVPLDFGPADPYVLLASIALPPSMLLQFKLRGRHRRAWEERNSSSDLIAALYQLGNRMRAGAGFDTALEETAASRRNSKFSEVVRAAVYRSKIRRNSVQTALREELSRTGADPLVVGAYGVVAECSTRNPSGAGQVALNLAQYLTDLRSCESKIEDKLKGLVDMMRSTSTVFAPIVLGITSSLVGLMSQFAVSSPTILSDTILLTGAYILELTAIVSFFAAFLQGGRDWSMVGYEVGKRAPLALAIFITTSVLCQMGMARLL